MPIAVCNRPELLVSAGDKEYDIVVVGGGITGTGIARDAAMRGLRTLLLERGDIGCGTSSRSSCLVHGGLRYLEHYRFGLVHESVAERWRLMKLAPHLVRPLPFLFPVYDGDKPGLFLISLGTFIYSMLSAFRTPGPRSRLAPPQLAEVEPLLGSNGLKGAAAYYDCSTRDARLTLETALAAGEAGAVVLPRSRFVAAQDKRNGMDVSFVDTITGQSYSVRARTLALAAGPWTDSVLPAAVPGAGRWLRTTKGVHLVFKAQRFPVQHAVVMPSIRNDGRSSFAVPWGSCTYVGTTDTDFPDPQAETAVNADDAAYLLDHCNHYFPSLSLSTDDVVSVWSGIRPLIAPEDEVTIDEEIDPSDISREERVSRINKRVIVVAGGKLTTYRNMARRVVNQLARTLAAEHDLSIPRSTTHKVPLPGAQDWLNPQQVLAGLQNQFDSLPSEWLADLANRYGTRAAEIAQLALDQSDLGDPLPGAERWRMAEVAWCIDREYACTVEDFLLRRTHIHHKTPDQGAQAASSVAQLISARAGLTQDAASRSVHAYLRSLGSWKAALQGTDPTAGPG